MPMRSACERLGIFLPRNLVRTMIPRWLPSVQPDGRIEVPGSADFDHMALAGQRRRKRCVGLLVLHDPSYRVIDLRHAETSKVTNSTDPSLRMATVTSGSLCGNRRTRLKASSSFSEATTPRTRHSRT